MENRLLSSAEDILDTPSILGSNELAHIVRASDSLSGWIETDIVKAKAP